jgi:Ca2+-binding EF-hand superfamily protein
LTDEQVAKLRKAFDVIDVDKDGYIGGAELQGLLGQLLGADASAEAVEGLIKLADANGDGRIDFEEFLVASMAGTA